MKKTYILVLIIFVFSFLSSSTAAQNGSSNAKRKILTIDDVGKWERLGFRGTALSNDGKWLVYPISRNNRESELRLSDLTKNTEKVLKNAGNQAFSKDSKWFAYLVSPDFKTRESLRKKKQPIRKTFELINLANGKTTSVKDISSFRFSNDGKFLVLEPRSDSKSKDKGKTVIVRNLDSNTDTVFGNVDDYQWSNIGSLLAMTIETKDKIGNGVKLFDGKSSITLESVDRNYKGLTWRKESNDLAVFRSIKSDDFEEPSNDILVWKNVSMTNTKPLVFDKAKTTNFPKNMRILNNSRLRWSSDGNSIFFSIDTWKKSSAKTDDKSKKEKPKDLPEIPALEIWNSTDVRTIPEQKFRANNTSYLSVWHLDTNQFVQIGSKQARIVTFQPDSKTLLAFDGTPYNFGAMFGRPKYHVYSVNIKTGTRKKIMENSIYTNNVSPDGKFFVYIKNDNYYLYNFATGNDTNLTQNLDASFVNLDDDHPVEQKFPYGFVGWDKTGSYFVAHSKFDIWKFDVNTGKGTRLTNGKTEQISHRMQRLDRTERYVNLNKPNYVRRFGNWSKKSGYAKLINGTNLQNLYWGDALVSRLTTAKNADVTAFSIEKYDDSPDLFVSKNGNSNIKQVSKTNPFENQYKIGKNELIEYTNANGKKLQGILYYPDDYVAGKKYPMITYIYERLSNGFHSYSVPSKTSYYNTRIFTSNGYFVLRPDIVFDAGDPGVSSTKTLEIAVKAVTDKGFVDSKTVGLVGHSWGGYQSAFAVTRTNIFAAAVAGAGLTNFISMYGAITPSFGNTFESGHFEVSQERMRVPPWEDLEGYLRNSAVTNIQNMQTPLLLEVGDADTNVNWRQSIEMYNAARRAKKDVVMLVYAKEGHGLRQRKNQMDYQKRILEWFGYYLKGEKPKRWIKDNITYSEQQDLLKKRELE